MKRLLIGALCLAGAAGAYATDFFSTEKCDELITYGARIGINTSNRTIDGNSFSYSHQSWGTGFDIGGVVNFNLRDYLTLQPGLFFESRSGRYTLFGAHHYDNNTFTEVAQSGKRNSYNFTIPLMAVIGFNVTDDVKWNVEAGPYVAFVLDSKLKNEGLVFNGVDENILFDQRASSVDFGFKLGLSVRVMQHYYFGTHYMAGCLGAWKDRKIGGNLTQSYGGVTKAWMFTLGYDF